MHELGIVGKALERKPRTTDSDYVYPQYSNLVEGLKVMRPDKTWMATQPEYSARHRDRKRVAGSRPAFHLRDWYHIAKSIFDRFVSQPLANAANWDLHFTLNPYKRDKLLGRGHSRHKFEDFLPAALSFALKNHDSLMKPENGIAI
jgi:hypothetical protein